MNHTPEQAAAMRELMKKLLEVTGTDPANHSLVISSLLNLAHNMARKYPCCTANASVLFLEMGARLVLVSPPPPQPDDEARPTGQHLH